MKLSDPVTIIPYIKDGYIKRLAKLNIQTVGDLLTHFPRYHKDESHVTPIGDILEAGKYTISAQVQSFSSFRLRTGNRTMQKAVLSDESGSIPASWFNQPYLEKALSKPGKYLFSGNAKVYRGSLSFFPNVYERDIDDKESVHLGRITPLYALTEGISIKWLRNRIKFLIDNLDLLEELAKIEKDVNKNDNHKFDLSKSISEIHFPDGEEMLVGAKAELELLELVNLQLKLAKQRADRAGISSPLIKYDSNLIEKFISKLPFELTTDQQTSISELLQSVGSKQPMTRLLQGDVGSGKTIVAVIAALAAASAGKQTVIMAPTTVLAEQHYQGFSKYLKSYDVSVELITGSTTTGKSSRERPDVLIGTSAVLARKQNLIEDLGLIVVDEQHRFGVKQREELLEPFTGVNEVQPHLLSMTATPIPRTLALALFSDLQVSTIKTKPAGRLPIKTFVVPEAKRTDSYDWIRTKVATEQQQVYWICPLIEESEKLEIASATTLHLQLISEFPEFEIGLLHGKLKTAEKTEIMDAFAKGDIDILVSTTVIEVGIDVPNATVMVIEGAERFGMAQLHQIRGRVGRSDIQSWCFLFPSSEITDEAANRLDFFANHTDGLEIAEYDLERRGPGEVYGTRQSGIPNLKIAQLTDLQKIKQSRVIADQLYPKVKSVELFN